MPIHDRADAPRGLNYLLEDAMRKHWKEAFVALVAIAATVVLVALALSGCSFGKSTASSSAKPVALKGPIVVGSKIDGEGALLGQIILQTLAANGFKVVDKTRTGATKVVRQALIDKQIDVYPEYTANGPLVFHSDVKVNPSILQSATLTWQVAKAEDASLGITWLWQAPANNTWAVAVPKKFATAHKLVTLEDLAKYINGGGAFKIAGSQEFFTSSVAFPAFEQAYGFKLAPAQEAQVGTGDTALPEKTAAQGTSGVNGTMAYGTDGTISALNLVVLTDTLGAQPIYEPAPTFRTEIIKKYPNIPILLNPVFARLDMPTLQKLNREVAVDGKDPKTVAKTWLATVGFVK
jgi:osmoprotectant transport system substrate-binding protein